MRNIVRQVIKLIRSDSCNFPLLYYNPDNDHTSVSLQPLKAIRRRIIDRMMKRRVGHTRPFLPLAASSPGAFQRLSREDRARRILPATCLFDLLLIVVSVCIFVSLRAGLSNRKVGNC
ncbi:hypothetical protein AVEN_78910-1 [Araneus ventricosus]|uniref:Uncharacterized protein n=1 Tax=Araneus ventricosus TaxID=182803 RepID=A0A4Y2DGI0_ARAVE|nr:hypothetical protein AVEN_78910-1 [Araneus ventricosus]